MGSTKDSHSILIYECCLYRSVHSLLTAAKIGKIIKLKFYDDKKLISARFLEVFRGCDSNSLRWFVWMWSRSDFMVYLIWTHSNQIPYSHAISLLRYQYGRSWQSNEYGEMWFVKVSVVISTFVVLPFYFWIGTYCFLILYCLPSAFALIYITRSVWLHSKYLSTVVSSGIFPRHEEGKFTILWMNSGDRSSGSDCWLL